MIMSTEADLNREALKLFRQLDLKIGVESLDFFKGESLYLKDWKKVYFKQRTGNIMASTAGSYDATGDGNTGGSSMVNPHRRICKGLSGSEGTPSSTPPTSNDNTDDDEIDDYYGPCGICDQPVIGEESGCLALEQIFHNRCFKCNKCFKILSGGNFFVKDGLVLCEKDYYLTLDKCYTCHQVIVDKIIRAIGHTYHPVCFRCAVCGICLDGVKFAADFSNKVYCENDFHKMFAPKCAGCHNPIIPLPGETKSQRLIAMNLSFHVDCYRCSECDVLLTTTDDKESRCYPIDDSPLCLHCNKKWSSNKSKKQIISLIPPTPLSKN